MPHPVFGGPDTEAAHNVRDLVIDCSRVSYVEHRAYYNEQDLQTVKFTLLPTTITTNNHQYNNENDDDDKNTSIGGPSIISGTSRLIYIGVDAFAYCKGLENVYSLPPSLRHIRPNAFGNCISLKHVDLPEGLQNIGEKAFQYCCALISVRIPSTVTAIADKTFSGCFRLLSLELPPTLKSIGVGAFSDCSSLVNVCLPTLVEEMPRHSFSSCTPLLTRLPLCTNALLLQSLQTRYDDDLPLHKLCYYQSYYESRDDLLSELQEILCKDDSGDKFLLKRDALGMNPLHVLALSARPNKELSSILLNHIRRRISSSSANSVVEDTLTATDGSYNDPLKYACYNISSGSGELIAQLIKTIHTKAIAQLGSQTWRAKIHRDIDRLFVGDEQWSGGEDNPGTTFESRRQMTKQVEQTVERYTMKERFALLELQSGKEAYNMLAKRQLIHSTEKIAERPVVRMSFFQTLLVFCTSGPIVKE
eukprot:CAMPEP_0113626362 /NCGR_PEP_ID=MMETSP0017_2-20120614/13632_1 /TAXON_ID=2856 /ORGANISM="Cylindrotheca closterium" /LENGTH=475 /DNA_ID=CAMNT_0000536537 /DNA_START=60 /DNA_END=1488 /DNA_ORIENTATION=- /assembly_acc=CAM_ASM_000147